MDMVTELHHSSKSKRLAGFFLLTTGISTGFIISEICRIVTKIFSFPHLGQSISIGVIELM